MRYRSIIRLSQPDDCTGIAFFSSAVLLLVSIFWVAPGDQVFAQNGEFTIVEQMPEYPGGFDALKVYLEKEVKYPEIAWKAGVEGRVYVTFNVGADGTVDHVFVTRGIGAGCDEEVVRAVRSMSRWSPGIQRGKPVAVRMGLPVDFKRDETPSVVANSGFQVLEDRMSVDYRIQGQIMSGNVVQLESGKPLAGAHVIVEGQSLGASAGPDGRFELDLSRAKDAKTVVVSHVGYQFYRISLP